MFGSRGYFGKKGAAAARRTPVAARAQGRPAVLLALAFLLFAGGLAAQGEDRRAAGIEYLPSPRVELGIEDVCCGVQPGFLPLPGATLATRFDDTSHWLHIATEGSAGVLMLSALVDEADLYLFDPATRQWNVMRSGDTRPVSVRPLVSARIAFPVPASPQPAEFYLRIRQPTAVGVSFVSQDAFRAATLRTAVVRAALLGAVIVMILFNLILSVAARDSGFFLNAGTISSLVLLDLYLSGVGSAYLWGESPHLSNHLISVALLATAFFGGLFFYAFLRDPAKPRSWPLTAILVCPALAILLLPVLPWVSYWRLQPFILGLVGLLVLADLSVVSIEMWRGNPRARLLLGPLVGGIVPGAALTVGRTVFGYEPPLGEHVLEITLAAEALLFSLALAYRLRVAQRERSEIQRSLLQHMQKSERLLLSAIDQERSRIASDLHDTAGQGLVTIVNRLARVAKRLNGSPHLAAELETITGASRATVGEIRRISHNLHSATLSKLGLSRALKSLAGETAFGSSIVVDVSIDDGVEGLSEERSVHVYRIVQELLTNVVKHSDASNCTVELRIQGEDITLQVKDDGRGMPSNGEGRSTQDGLGLELMAQRVRSLGGHWTARRLAPGTTVDICFPRTPPMEEGTG